MIRKVSIFVLFFLFSVGLCNATHNRAGEITYKWITGTTYEITVTTYTKESSQADRCQLTIYFGDGDSCVAGRTNGPPTANTSSGYHLDCTPYGTGVVLANDTKINTYSCTHTYPGAGNYWITMEDPNRNGGIYNIPNSINTVFYIRSELIINNFLGTGHNSSPVLLNPPIDNGCTNKCFYHNPGAYDPDGDSLSFRLDTCLESGGITIPGWTTPPTTSVYSLNPVTGDLVWCTPPVQGQFNIAIVVEEWRNGYLLGSVERDMQINIAACSNNPPDILPLNDTCVEAGATIKFKVTAHDPDGNNVYLSSVGGPLSPFVATPSATFPPSFGGSTAFSTFTWNTVCAHIRKQPYIVTFKASDDGAVTPLASYKTIEITVVAPAPKNVTATPSGSSMDINWTASNCTSLLAGYRIYRKDSCSDFIHSPCQKGVPSTSGYTLIGTVDAPTTFFNDNNNGQGLVHGVDYSYIVDAFYADGSESFASAKSCAKLVIDVPIITNVSVDTTDHGKGKMLIRWLKPIGDSTAKNLDTITNVGPYEFRLMHATGFSGTFSQVASFSNQWFKLLNDTSYIDTLLNTDTDPYDYRLDFYANGGFLGSTNNASSVYLTITPYDNKLALSWEEHVPWINSTYVVYKLNESTLKYDSLAQTSLKTYTDTGLVNGHSYCYKIKSIGAYSDATLPAPLINYSEEKCESPVDKQAPCAPKLSVDPDCIAITNSLKWTNPDNQNCNTDDVVLYKIYYTPIEKEPYQLLYTTSVYSSTDTTFLHSNITSIAGCYVVTAVDTFNNESVYSNSFCVDNCPEYELPNVFTPDGDGKNDYFKPFPYKFVKDVDMKIYDRWGLLVFETTDANIRWDGKNKDSKQPCSEGTYFYICIVNEIHVEGIKQRPLKGFIQLIDSKGNPPSH